MRDAKSKILTRGDLEIHASWGGQSHGEKGFSYVVFWIDHMNGGERHVYKVGNALFQDTEGPTHRRLADILAIMQVDLEDGK